LPDSTYQKTEYGAPIRTIDHIAAQDDEAYNPDIWIKIMAADASGNQCVREISFPILPEERPVIDITGVYRDSFFFVTD
jgi:hypothetical protein